MARKAIGAGRRQHPVGAVRGSVDRFPARSRRFGQGTCSPRPRCADAASWPCPAKSRDMLALFSYIHLFTPQDAPFIGAGRNAGSRVSCIFAISFFVTCRGGIRSRRIRHGMLPLDCKDKPVVEKSGAKLTRSRPGWFPKHSDKRQCVRPSAREADCSESRWSRLASSDLVPSARLAAHLARFDRKSSFRPTVFCLPLIRRHFCVSTSNIGLRSSSEYSGPLVNGPRGQSFLCHTAGLYMSLAADMIGLQCGSLDV